MKLQGIKPSLLKSLITKSIHLLVIFSYLTLTLAPNYVLATQTTTETETRPRRQTLHLRPFPAPPEQSVPHYKIRLTPNENAGHFTLTIRKKVGPEVIDFAPEPLTPAKRAFLIEGLGNLEIQPNGLATLSRAHLNTDLLSLSVRAPQGLTLNNFNFNRLKSKSLLTFDNYVTAQTTHLAGQDPEKLLLSIKQNATFKTKDLSLNHGKALILGTLSLQHSTLQGQDSSYWIAPSGSLAGSITAGRLNQVVNHGSVMLPNSTLEVQGGNNKGTLVTRALDVAGEFTNYNQLQTQTLSGQGNIFNQGFLGGDDCQFIIQGRLENQGVIKTRELSGSGAFYNRGLFYGIQGNSASTEQTIHSLLPTRISITQFYNGDFSSTAKIIANDLTFTKDVREWINDGGLIEGGTIRFAEGALHPINRGTLNIQELHLQNRHFTNEGIMELKSAYLQGLTFFNTLQGKVHIYQDFSLGLNHIRNSGEMGIVGDITGQVRDWTSSGTLLVKGKVSLPSSTLKNKGKALFEQHICLNTLKNSQSFHALSGITITKGLNTGTSTIEQDFTLKGEMENSGILRFRKMHMLTAYQESHLINHKRVILEDGHFRVSHLTNHHHLELLNGTHSITDLNNTGTLFFNGVPWCLLANNEPSSGNHLAVERVHNSGQLVAEKDFLYEHHDPQGRIVSGGGIVLRRLQALLTEQDLQELYALFGVKVEARGLEVTQASEVPSPMTLYLQEDLITRNVLKLPAVEAFIQGGFIGGLNNETMGGIQTTEGPLHLEASSIDARYSRIFGQGPTEVIATQSNVDVGAVKEQTSGLPAWFAYWLNNSHMKRDTYQRKILNGAYIASASSLDIKSIQGQINVDYGELFAQGAMHLNVPNEDGLVRALTGQIRSTGNIYFNGQRFLATRPDQLMRYAICYTPDSRGYSIAFPFECADQATVQSGGNIHFNMQDVSIEYSTVLASGSIYKNHELVASREQKYRGLFNLLSRHERENHQACGHPCSRRNTPAVAVPAVVTAGEQVHIDAGPMTVSGSLNGGLGVQLNLSSLVAECSSLTRKDRNSLDTHLIIDLHELSQASYKNSGFIRTLSDGRITTDHPLEQSLIPTADQLLYYHHTENTSIPRFLIDPVPLEFIVQEALAKEIGTLNIQGLSGRKLLQQLFRNAQEYREETGADLITQADIAKTKQACIAFVSKRVQEEIMLAAQLIVPSHLQHSYNQSGDISSPNGFVGINTTESQTHKNNRVFGRWGINAYSGRKIQRETEKYTSIYGLDSKTIVHEERAYPQQQFISDEGAVEILGAEGYHEIGTHTAAGTDLTLGASNGHMTSQPLELTTTTVTTETKRRTMGGKKTTTTTTTTSTNMPCTHQSERDTTNYAEEQLVLQGTQGTAGRHYTLEGRQGVSLLAMTDSFQQTINSSSKGGVGGRKGRQEQTQKQTQRPVSLTAGGRMAIRSPEGDILDQASTLKAGQGISFSSPAGKLILKAVRDTYFHSVQKSSSNMAWQSFVNEGESSSTVRQGVYDPGEGKITIDAPEVSVEKRAKDLHTLDALFKALKDHDNVTWQGLHDTYEAWHEEHHSLSPALGVVIGIGIGLLTAGTGYGATVAGLLELGETAAATFVTGAVNAGISSLASQASISMINNQGDIGAVLKELSSEKSLRSLVTTMATAGLTKVGCQELKINLGSAEKPQSFIDRAKESLVRCNVSLLANTIINREDFHQALQSNLRATMADTLAGHAAAKIGVAYHSSDASGPQLDEVSHKLLHALVGAGMAAITKGDILAGSVGAVIGEIVAAQYRENLGEEYDPSKDNFEKLKERGVQLARLSAAFAAFLTGRDPNDAAMAAGNAARENAMQVTFEQHLEEQQASAPATEEEEEGEEEEEPGVKAAILNSLETYDREKEVQEQQEEEEGRIGILEDIFTPQTEAEWDAFRQARAELEENDPVTSTRDKGKERVYDWDEEAELAPTTGSANGSIAGRVAETRHRQIDHLLGGAAESAQSSSSSAAREDFDIYTRLLFRENPAQPDDEYILDIRRQDLKGDRPTAFAQSKQGLWEALIRGSDNNSNFIAVQIKELKAQGEWEDMPLDLKNSFINAAANNEVGKILVPPFIQAGRGIRDAVNIGMQQTLAPVLDPDYVTHEQRISDLMETDAAWQRFSPKYQAIMLERARDRDQSDKATAEFILGALQVEEKISKAAEYAGDGLQAGLQRLGASWEEARTTREGLSDVGSVASFFIPGTVVLKAAKVTVNGAKKLSIVKLSSKTKKKDTLNQLKILRNRQGRVKGVTYVQNHHIISNKTSYLGEHSLWQKAGISPESPLNKMLLPTKKGALFSTTTRSIHQGRHRNTVHERLLKQMERTVRQGIKNNWTQIQYFNALKSVIKKERKVLKSGNRILNKHHRPGATDQG